jgi:hypothetical protein
MADDGPLQLSLFDQQDLAEIMSPDFPGERLVACRNPVLAADRARTREELLAATEKTDLDSPQPTGPLNATESRFAPVSFARRRSALPRPRRGGPRRRGLRR